MKTLFYLLTFLCFTITNDSSLGQNFWNTYTNGLLGIDVRSIYSDKDGYLYAGKWSALNGSALSRSSNYGETWSTTVNGIIGTSGIFAISEDTAAGTLYCAGGGGVIYKSTNNGNNWELINSGINTNSIIQSICVTSTNNILVGLNTGEIYKTTNNGLSWVVTGGLYQKSVTAIKKLSNGVIICSTIVGFLISYDDGQTWSLNNQITGLYIKTVNTLWVSDNDILYAGTRGLEGAGGTSDNATGIIYKSTDYGVTWTKIKQRNHPNDYCVGIIQNKLGDFYAAIRPGSTTYPEKVIKSTDNGITWIVIDSGIYLTHFPTCLSIDKQGYIYYGNSFGIYRSINPTNPNVHMTSPNGGENWVVGEQKDITWTSIEIENVKIEYTIDNGNYWNPVINSTPANLGSYTWTIPNTPSTQCKIRISDVLNNSITDTSANTFTISEAPSIIVNSPIAGSIWNALSQQTITWSSINVLGNVNIKLSIDGSTFPITLKNNTPNDGSEEITVPNNPSSACRIRVESFGNPNNIFGLNDGNFTITPPVDVVEIINNQPNEFALYQNFPNPFNPVTRIYYSVPTESQVTIKLFNTLGEEIKTLVNEIKSTGNYWVDLDGRQLQSGIYIYQMKSESFQTSKKLILLK